MKNSQWSYVMGFFLLVKVRTNLMCGKVSHFYHCEVDTWSIVWIDDFLCQLHYPQGSRPTGALAFTRQGFVKWA